MFGTSLGLDWFTPFILLGIYGAIRYVARPRQKEPGSINWTPLEAAGITVAIYFISQLAGALLIYIFPLIAGVKQATITNWLNSNVYGQFILIATIELLTFIMITNFLKRRAASLKTIGLTKPKWSAIGYVLIGFIIYFVSYLLILNLVKSAVRINENQKQVIGFDGAHGSQLPFVFISLVILPPLVEEILVRGFLYSGLKKGLPIIWAAIITSAMFATAHLQAGSGEPLLWSAALDTFILSFVLIYLREKTGNLWASIGLHMLKNGIAFASLFVFHLT